jgi:hypothetical protein
MKIIITILLGILSYHAIAQTEHETITKGDNIIIIKTSTSGDSAFIACSKYLVGKGYVFQSRDETLGQIITDQKSYAGAFNYKLNIVCSDHQIRIRALVQVMTLGLQLAWTDWYYAKAKGNLMNDAYSKFHPHLLEMKSNFTTGSGIFYTKE